MTIFVQRNRLYCIVSYFLKIPLKLATTLHSGHYRRLMDLPSTDSIKSIGLNQVSYHLLGPYSLTVTMRVTEQWWEESTPSSPRSPGSLLTVRVSVLRPSCTSEAGEVVYSLAENKTNISTASFLTVKSCSTLWPIQQNFRKCSRKCVSPNFGYITQKNSKKIS